MYTNTSAIAQNSPFKHVSDPLPLDYHEERIKLATPRVTSLYLYDKPVYLTAKSGISALVVSKHLSGPYQQLVLHGRVKIEPQTYFNLINLSGESQIGLAHAPSVQVTENALEAPIFWKPADLNLQISEIYEISQSEKEGLHQFEADQHDFCELVIVEQGEMKTVVDGTSHKLTRHDAFLYYSGQEHQQIIPADSKTSYITVLFDMKAVEPQFFNRVFHLGTSQFSQLETLIRINQLEDQPYKNDQLLARLKLFVLSLISDVQPLLIGVTTMKEHSGKEVCQKIMAYIKEHPEAKVIDISKTFNLSRSNIQALFHRFVHMQPHAYIEAQRLNQAKVLIRESSYSMTEIAKLVGYRSLPAFSRSFKHAFGYSPSRYAKQFYKIV